jgi:hypothetical protein
MSTGLAADKKLPDVGQNDKAFRELEEIFVNALHRVLTK